MNRRQMLKGLGATAAMGATMRVPDLFAASKVDSTYKGVKLGLNHPMGPLELADLIGLDTCLSIAEVLQRELGDDKYRPSPLLRQYVAAGWLGRKTGRGFHQY